MRANLFLSSVLVATVFAAGCEWTSSDGFSWDESYNNVNFSGTYPIGTIVTEDPNAGGAGGTASATDTINGGSGQLRCSGIQSATVTVYATDGGSSTGSGGPGKLAFDNPNYSGSVTESGAVNCSIKGGAVKNMKVSYTYANSVPATKGSTVTAITVHQTGQNITMTLNNGAAFSGKISGFDTNAESVQASTQIIAKYNVSGDTGSISGTLTSTTSNRTIDGTMKIGKSSNAFSGSISGAGRTVSSSSSAAE